MALRNLGLRTVATLTPKSDKLHHIVGVAGVAQDVVYPPALNDAPSVHDRNAVGDLDGDANVVRDENNRQPELLL